MRKPIANMGIMGRFITIRITFPINMLAISAQTRSGFVVNIIGPGFSPNIIRAPSMTAVAPEPGMPRAKRCTMAPEVQALLEDSGVDPFDRTFAEAIGIIGNALFDGIRNK